MPCSRPARSRHAPRRRRPRWRVAGWLAAVGLLLAVVPARATVAEQRARLPPPAECTDPIAGIWRAHHFIPDQGTWYVRTLEIRRETEGAAKLTGLVWSDYWYGTSKDQEPPACNAAAGYHAVVRMPAVGTFRDGEVAFGGTSWTLDRLVCGRGSHGYNPDRFTGRIDPALQEFQSVNNDGGQAVNEPAVFRRIQCFDEPAPLPSVSVVPPPPFSSSRKEGCQCTAGGRPSRSGFDLGLLPVACAAVVRRSAARRGRRVRP